MKRQIAGPLLLAGVLLSGATLTAQTTAPSIYNAYTGTDVKVAPPAPALGTANSVITDPTFGSRILRVTDANTRGGESFISTDSGFSRTWNANSTAIKLTGPSGDGYWLEFNPSTFQAGTGSGEPALHPVSFGATWEWSAVQPNIIYYLSGSAIETYNTATGASTPVASTPTGDPVTYMAAVVGLDNWVCAAAGKGSQDTYTKIFCVSPSNPSTYEFIDVANETINGQAQSPLNWPAAAAGETIGIHDISGGTGPNWLEVTFHQQSWGANGGAVLDLSTNTWSLVTHADPYWSGHVSMGNGTYENSSGSINGDDSRGTVLRDPDNLMNSSQYLFVMQPPAPWNNWCDADHSSWLNSLTNPNAPVLDSRYSATASCQFAWSDEIVAAAVDGSNTVWRFAHNFNGGSQCYYAQAFAQISNDGNWALFSSYWGGTLGPDTSFGCTSRIDTFIVDLKDATGPPTTIAGSPTTTTPAPVTSNVVQYLANNPAVQYTGAWSPNSGAFNIGSVATLSMSANSSAVLPFTGTDVQWIGFSDPWSGIAQVYLDGVLTATIDTYSAVQVAQKVQYSVSNLANAAHILTIVATGTMDSSSAGEWVWVNAFEVTAPSAAAAAPSTPTPANTPALGITTTSALPSGTAGASYSQTLAASGGAPPYTWTLASGTLPAGLSLAGGVISGTPVAAGASTFAIQVADSASATASQSVLLTVAQSSVSFTSAGSMAQIASGGSWSTTITLVNNGMAPADIQLSFYDDNGAPLTLPLTFPQTSSSTGLLAATLNQTIAAGAGLVIVTSGPASQATQEGWAQLLTDSSGVSGFAVFAWSGSTGAEAAVAPLQGANTGSWVLWFDNTGGNATGVALANVASAPAVVPAIVRDDAGTIVTSSSVALAALAHESFMVATQYPQTAGKRGTIEFKTPGGGQVGVLGLQASASGALTSVPPLAQ